MHCPPPLVSSYERDSITASLEIAPGWPRGFLFDRRPSDWKTAIAALDPATLNTSHRGLSKSKVAELKATGHPTAPYVGVLRYHENLYTCSDRAATRCSVAAQTPVTEIFRFQNGRWIY